MVASYDATKKAVIASRERGATSPGPQGVLRAFALSTAGANRLGEALWTLKYEARDKREAFKVAALLLRRALPDPDPRLFGVFERVVNAALTEWLFDQCGKCRGRGRTGAGREIIETKRVPCPTCQGAGRLFSLSARWARYAGSGAIVGNEIPPATTIERGCEPCVGKGFRTLTQKRNSRLRGCVTCHGTGKRLYRDKERALALGLTGHQFSLWAPVYREALRQLRAIDAETAVRVDFRRERGENPDAPGATRAHIASEPEDEPLPAPDEPGEERAP